MLGVLIALFVNDWYARVQQRAQEVAWVEGIRDDLLSDQATLEHELDAAAAAAETIRVLIADVDDPVSDVPDTASYLRMLKDANIAGFFRPIATTYTELTGGGNISKLSNREFVRAVINYHHQALLTNDLNEYFRQVRWFDYSSTVMELLDPVAYAAVTEDWHRRQGMWPADDDSSDPLLSTESVDLTALRTRPAFRVALGVGLDATVVQRGNLFRLLAACKDVLALAEAELARLTN